MQGKQYQSVLADNSSDSLIPDQPTSRARRFAIGSSAILPDSFSNITQERVSLVTKLDRSAAYQGGMLGVIVCSFVLSEVREIWVPAAGDWYVDGVMLGLLAMFIWDNTLQCMQRPNYLWSLFFILDLLATATFLGEISYFASKSVHDCAGLRLWTHQIVSRAARLGANTPRLLRYFRSKPPVPATPCEPQTPFLPPEDPPSPLEAAEKSRESKDRGSTEVPKPSQRRLKKHRTLGRLYGTHPTPQLLPGSSVPPPIESEISKLLSTHTITLLSLISLAITFVSLWITYISTAQFPLSSYEYGLRLLFDAQNQINFPEIALEVVMNTSQSQDLDKIVKLEIKNRYIWGEISENTRNIELCKIKFENVTAHVDYSRLLQMESVFSLCKTFILCLFMTSIVLLFTKDMQKLVVFPLERMMETAVTLGQNPLDVVNMSHDRSKSLIQGKSKDYARAEIRVLENAFRKIGVMLALVFGSAGSEMIASSLQSDSRYMSLISGKAVLAIFCFARIVGFEELLDALGPHVLKYMYLVSRFVHSQSEKYGGSVNRNMGDSYLLVWSFPQDDLLIINHKYVVNAYSENVHRVTSLALLSAVKSSYKVAKSFHLLRYHVDNKVVAKTELDRPKLTFGFHVGWAYEGPIGSLFKIDASYLSPHVNISSRVESACKRYGVTILCSEEFVVRLIPEVQSYLRCIDRVTLKGVKTPLSLYTFDIDISNLVLISKSQPVKHRIERARRKIKSAIQTGLFQVQELFTKSHDLALMRKEYTEAFLQRFGEGVERYLEGQWEDARKKFQETLEMKGNDGPSLNLLTYMRSKGFVAPKDWQGVRELLEK